ncbi:MAG: calcium-translocating P-type ATPase, PMCA-type [Bacilli bacterium]|nr:calcium-translocating P-type ATPase, PMCA-type [Bacilli bacterium]
MNTNYNKGLSNEEVLLSRKKYGSNKIINKKKNSFIRLVFESLNDPIIKILLIALCIKIIFLFHDSNIYETLGIAISIFLASFISAISEYGSEKAFEKLEEENNNINVKVLRDGNKIITKMDDIVVGDIVYLESGDKVPADGVIVKGEIVVDESYLTGETIEKNKSVNDEVYMGSIVNEKSAILRINLVGEKTYYGKIASDIQEKSNPSPLKMKLTDLAKFISKIGYIGAILVFISYIFNAVIVKYNFDLIKIFDFNILFPHIIYALTLSVAVVVMAVPEGLPMMITLVLSSNMKRLLKKNVLVRKLVGIETSGSLNILFSDKTGTLTEGKLLMESFISPDLIEFEKIINNYDIVYQSLIYNNESFYNNGKSEGGNTTDRAIIDFFKTDKKDKYNIINKQLFNSNLKYSYVVTDYNKKTVFFKGAYEIILNKCNKYLANDGKINYLIDKEKIEKYMKDKMLKGNRILALAISDSEEFNYLTLVGFIILKDKIRKEAYKGIELIKKSGVQVVMVTGDAMETAVSVARELKIINGEEDIALTSEEFNKLSDEEVKSKLKHLKVLSRSLPQDKNRLVKIALEEDLVVGMTGDGVNDAPALKRASVGFSMGSGTEIAKEVSDIVILDNNIMSISTAILYGRTIFKSIRKFIIFQLSVNCCAVLLSIIGPFIGILSPITVIQVLWVNMVMDTFAGLAFSFEPALIEYMYEEPKKKNESIINKYMINQIINDGIFSMLICIWFLKSNIIHSIYRYSIDNKYVLTAFFGLFIFIDIFNAFNSRTHRINTFSGLLKNKIFLMVFIFITIVQVLLIYFGGEIFRTTGLTIYEFEIMIIVAFSVIPFDIARKIILKKKGIDMGV